MSERFHYSIDPSHHISVQDLALLGLQDVAYIRPLSVGDTEGFGIFGADGRQIGFSLDRDVAIAAIRQNDLEPLSLH